MALNDAATLYRDAPEAHGARASVDRTIQVFVREALPEASEPTRALAGNLITTTLSAVGKQFSESPRAPGDRSLRRGDGQRDQDHQQQS